MQRQYWKYMVQMRAWIFYLDIYAENSYKMERRINVFSAVASSTSIAAWVIWEQFSFIWSAVIAVSQVISAVKSFFPYNTRLKIIIPFAEDIKILYSKIEFNWYNVASGELTEEEINTLLFGFKSSFTDIENKYLKEEMLVERLDFMYIADCKTEAYFKKNF